MKNKKIITAEKAAKLLCVGRTTAWRRIRTAKDALGVSLLTVRSFCEYYELDINQLKNKKKL